jgi:hypothetical protein
MGCVDWRLTVVARCSITVCMLVLEVLVIGTLTGAGMDVEPLPVSTIYWGWTNLVIRPLPASKTYELGLVIEHHADDHARCSDALMLPETSSLGCGFYNSS